MLNKICENWNNLYACTDPKLYNHKAKIVGGTVNVHENQVQDNCFTDLYFNVKEAIEFPSREFCSYSAWNSLSNKNCDGAYLIEKTNNTYELVLIELKSAFDTNEILKAKEQIVASLIKLKILLTCSKYFSQINIIRSVGLIVSCLPNENTLPYLKDMLMLNDEDLGRKKFAINLYKNKHCEADIRDDRFSARIIGNKIDVYYHCCSGTSTTIDLNEVLYK